MAVYSCTGFAGGFIGTLLFGLSLDWFGGTGRLAAWAVAFGSATACLFGAIGTAFLSSGLGPESFGVTRREGNRAEGRGPDRGLVRRTASDCGR